MNTQPHRPQGRRARRLLASAAVLALACAGAAHAQPARTAPPQELSLPAGALETALLALAAQTHQQLLYAPDLVQGRRVEALSGRFTVEQALARLTAGQDVAVARTGPNVVVLKRRPIPTAASAVDAPLGANPRPFGGEAGGPPASEPPVTTAHAEASPPRASGLANTVEAVQVTGTHIRGAGQTVSPVLVLDREDLDRSGQATVAGALNALPQVFGGESTEGTVATRADLLGSNLTYGTGVNLRGLGTDATLVLVNGQRIAGSGTKGDFVDLSTFPTVAIQRVEVLLDGASALYGSDAVGGVVNLILRRDWEGLELRARAGSSTAGGAAEGQLGLAFGRGWSGGNLFVAVEADRRAALAASDRWFTANADLRPYGGLDRRETFSFPGNIAQLDPVTRTNVPTFGIPPGQSGVGLTPAAFQAGVLNRQTPQLGADILPDQRGWSLYAAANQHLGERLEVSGDLRYGYRRATAALLPSTTTLTVARANPFYVSPVGAASEQIFYSFQGELPNPRALRTAETMTATLDGKLDLVRDWRAEGYLAAAQEIDESTSSGQVNSTLLSEALGNSADNPATPYSPARDGFFNPFTGVAANPAAVTSAIGSGFTKNRPRSRFLTFNLQADGTLLTLPGGPLKAAVGVQARREDFRADGSTFTSGVAPRAQTPSYGSRIVTAAFAELRAPLVAPDPDRTGLNALELSVAARSERYSDFGDTFNPKAGLLWTPAPGLHVRATYGTSFKAPTTRDLNTAPINTALNLPQGASTVLTFSLQGGNPNLRPETAKSWTLGADWRPASIPGLQLSATWFRTDFKDRIDRPVAQNTGTVLSDPRFAMFVQRINPQSNADDLALIKRLLADPATIASSNPPENYRAIVDIRLVNTGALLVDGVDLTGTYDRDAFGGRLTLGGNLSRLLDYEEKLTPAAAATELAGVATYPAKLRARLTADWTRGSWSGGLALNRTSGFKSTTGASIDGQTTVDLQARWRPEPASPWAGLSATLIVRNLFDRDPPFYDNPFGFAYDPASGDPIGRFVALQLDRRW